MAVTSASANASTPSVTATTDHKGKGKGSDKGKNYKNHKNQNQNQNHVSDSKRRQGNSAVSRAGIPSSEDAKLSTTRVCIKNLPPNATEYDLKEFLKKSSTTSTTTTQNSGVDITDCKVLKNAKGKSRKVAFVGFRKEEHAKYVIDQFDKSFMGMSRLSVQAAFMATANHMENKNTNNDSSSSDNMKTSSSTSTSKETKSKEQQQEPLSKQKQEILELFGNGKKTKIWANDEQTVDATGAAAVPSSTRKNMEGHNGNDSGSSSSSNTSDSSDSSSDGSDSDSDSDNEDNDDKQKDEKAKKTAAVSDLDFLRSKQTKKEDLDIQEGSQEVTMKSREDDMMTDSEAEKEDDSSSSSSSSSDDDDDGIAEQSVNRKQNVVKRDDETETENHVNKSIEDKNEEDQDEDAMERERNNLEETSQSRLFVRNLPFNTTEEELQEYFATFGTLTECHIPVDDQKRNKGFAFIQFSAAVDALEARKQLDKIDFQGRLLHILPARPAPQSTNGGDANDKHLTWKQKQELARKEQDVKNGSAQGWSASFVRGDAVADSLAERLGLRKADFLGVKDKLSSGDAAVRLALGETQIIEENREYFRKNGVDMDALVSANSNETKRSKTSILVKNLPFDTRAEELTKLFQTSDENVTVLLPPSRTIALIEFEHHSDAKKMFKRLAYRRFKHVPIYLEWAPLAAKKDETKGVEINEKENSSRDPTTSTQDLKNSLQQPVEDYDADVTAGIVSTIYVKNLNFATGEDALRKVFEKNVGPVRSVRIPQKIVPARNGEEPQIQSMGYGFVELDSESLVRKALQVLQGKMVEGHAWEVTISANKSNTGKSKLSTSSKNPTKLIVRNVPFQATRSEILKLFGSFGQLRRVRLPKKFDGSHRGFAFVEFLTSKEAVNAMNSLSRTHLYGRHLVLEWATDDDQDMDHLRDKAKRDTLTQGLMAAPKNKRIKFF